MSTHDLYFRAKKRKNVYPCKPQLYSIKVGCKVYKLQGRVILMKPSFIQATFEPRSEKTGFRGFRPGPTLTRLYNHKRLLETSNFGFRK